MINLKSEQIHSDAYQHKIIKCLVWDLDNTLWHGVLLEDKHVNLHDDVIHIIKTLDSRGILQSIASKNDHKRAMDKLQEWGLQEYFLYPQINWNSKAHSIQKISQSINISLENIAFIDDQDFELAEVRCYYPQVICFQASDLRQLLDIPEMNPSLITEDAKQRRMMYLSDINRKQDEETFFGSQEEFLATLNMHLTISSAQIEDLQRASELTVRTHQLNTTGYTYSYEELNHFRQSDQHKLLIAELNDKYGNYGKIGLALIECQPDKWTIQLLLMSCRVMSRGVGTVILNYLIKLAQDHHVTLYAQFVANNQNRMMYITYKFAGFEEFKSCEKLTLLTHNFSQVQPFPEYMTIEIKN
ncbi:MAG: HAD-IIIC family phosphatase [Nodularia sp. (in: Bacteria)]|nr:MAG: HAD-IIIC family phosphatase [Nodularia sp. (in: cyanobacteria)]